MSGQQSMPQDLVQTNNYTEVWEVYMSNQREPYYLNELEYSVFRKALLQGIKGVVHFDKFGLNTSFYVSSYRKSRTLKPDHTIEQLENLNEQEMNPEDHIKARQKIKEIRQKLNDKFKQE